MNIRMYFKFEEFPETIIKNAGGLNLFSGSPGA
jgi:hypothetical protein